MKTTEPTVEDLRKLFTMCAQRAHDILGDDYDERIAEPMETIRKAMAAHADPCPLSVACNLSKFITPEMIQDFPSMHIELQAAAYELKFGKHTMGIN